MNKNKGFSLIELMVGVTIGLIALIFVVKTVTTFDSGKRKTTGNADAQTNALIALHLIKNEVQLGGYGYPYSDVFNPLLRCTSMVNPAGSGVDQFFPVQIVDGGTAAGASDTVTVHYANSTTGGTSVKVSSVSGNNYMVDFSGACKEGSIAIVTKDSSCGYSKVTSSTTGQVTLADGSTMSAALGSAVDASVSCVSQMNTVTFRSDGEDLLMNGNVIMSDIVNMQAQYGISDTATSNVVTSWVDASGAWVAPGVSDRNRIKAIRIAIVARNTSMDTTAVTGGCVTDKGTVNVGPCAWNDLTVSKAPKIDLSNIQDWNKYRYRSFDIVIPIRNIIWSSNSL